MPLRIAHITNEAFGLETANGIQHVVYSLALAQAEMGESVVVFSRDDHAVNALGDGGGRASRRPTTLGGGPGLSLRQRLLSRYFEWPLAEDVLAWQPDLVHFHSVHIPQNVALAAQLVPAGVPYCVTVHGALFRVALRRGWLKKRVFDLLFERRYLNEARFIHALSPHEAEAVRRHGVDRPIVMAPNGVPEISVPALGPEALDAHIPDRRGRQVFMFMGRLDPWQKGLDLLLTAFADAGLRDAALVLVGPDCRGSRLALATRAKRLGILPRLTFIEPVFGEERANLLAVADVFVHPSRWEGQSLSVLAAAAAGKLCLITREADPLGTLEGAQAAVIVESNVSSISDGLQRAAALSRHDLQVMGTRARNVVEANFAWPSTARTLAEAYRRALKYERRAGPLENACG